MHAIQLELMLVGLGMLALLGDAFVPQLHARRLGCALALAVAGILLYSFRLTPSDVPAFSGMVRVDALALFFARLFLLATLLVLVVTANDTEVLRTGAAAFFAIVLFAAAGMLLMASADDFFMMFVALELVTVGFYVLTSYLRGSGASLEAGVKYLTLGTLSSSFLVFGIAFVFGSTGTMNFEVLRALPAAMKDQPTFVFGAMLITAGLGFKIASVPFQMWAPDVYQGAPTPAMGFLATGSKAAGFAVLMRLFLTGIFPLGGQGAELIALFAAATILYGVLGALGQRDLKRLLGYASISHGGYLMLGLAAFNQLGLGALLYYLVQDAVTMLCAVLVLVGVHRATGTVTLAGLAGLHKRSPLLALALFVSMMSLAGVPPLSGALGKFFLFGAVMQRGAVEHSYLALAAIAAISVVIGLFFYLGVLRAAFVEPADNDAPIPLTKSLATALVACTVAIVLLGIFPQPLLHAAMQTVQSLGAALP